jgi:DinB superfamily
MRPAHVQSEASSNPRENIVRVSIGAAALALTCCLPALAAAQGAPVADAFKENAKHAGANLIAAAEEMPADKYAYKPTPAQMSFGQIVTHLAEGNDYLCGAIGGTKAPARAKLDAAADSKDKLVAALKETFAFCDQALASLDDSKLGEQVPFFGGKTRTRASIMTITTGDWADHYSQSAIYLRLNNLLPPTAKKTSM